MPIWMTLLITGVAWTCFVVVVWGLLAAAGRADRRADRLREERAALPGVVPAAPAPAASHQSPPVVVDVADVLARLRVAERVLDAERLWLTVPSARGESILATSRPVLRVTGTEVERLRTPVVVGEAEVGALYAERRAAAGFDGGDRLLLDALAARLADLLAVGHPSSARPAALLQALG